MHQNSHEESVERDRENEAGTQQLQRYSYQPRDRKLLTRA